MPPTHLKMKLNFSCLCFPVYDPFQQPGIETPFCMGGQLYCLPIQCFNVNKKQISNMLQSVQFSSVAQSCPTLCDLMNHSTPGLPVYHQLPEFTQTHVHQSVMPSSHLILCHPLLLLPPIPPSTKVFSNESTVRMRWAKYWSFGFSIIPSKEHPGLISFRMD